MSCYVFHEGRHRGSPRQYVFHEGAWRLVIMPWVSCGRIWRAADSCSWHTGEWGPCSLPCGGGISQRRVECLDASGRVTAPARCAGTRPDPSQACNTHPCTQTQYNNTPYSPYYVLVCPTRIVFYWGRSIGTSVTTTLIVGNYRYSTGRYRIATKCSGNVSVPDGQMYEIVQTQLA